MVCQTVEENIFRLHHTTACKHPHSTDCRTAIPQSAEPLDSEGNVSKDESAWIEVAKETISCNKPKTLEFYVPDSIAQANYKIVIRTRYCSGEKQLKSVLSTFSKTVNVAA